MAYPDLKSGNGTAKYQTTIDTVFVMTKNAYTPADLAQGASVLINPSSGTAPSKDMFVDGSCATNEISFTGGQKTDIEVTTLCSTTQEVTNGLAAPAEITINRNWAADDEMLTHLEKAYNNNEIRGFVVEFTSNLTDPSNPGSSIQAASGYAFFAEVRQYTWSVATAGKVAASYTLRVRGKPYPFLQLT